MLGAIAGDIIGSIYEFNNIKSKDFSLFTPASTFTDDTICTVAIIDSLLHSLDPQEAMLDWCRKYPELSYGTRFRQWIFSNDPRPYHSFGNGAAMRISPVAWVAEGEEHLFELSDKYTAITHDHKEGLKGARAIALAVYLTKKGLCSKDLKLELTKNFSYDLNATVDEIRSNYCFDETCQGTVPQSIICFLEAESFEDAIRNAISIGGDSDTVGAIVGSIAEAKWGVDEHISKEVWKRLTPDIQQILIKVY